MTTKRFRNRQDAARRLAEELKHFDLHDPVVLGVPRGGVETAAVLAEQLGAEMDVVLARKLRHPWQPELAIGSISESGEAYLNAHARSAAITPEYLSSEQQLRSAELEQRRALFRQVRPAVPLEGRSVILTDDGIATGSTMWAALAVIQAQRPGEIILAVPVAPPDRLKPFLGQCDHVVCPLRPKSFLSIGQFYEDFEQVDDERVCELLRAQLIGNE